MVFYFPGKVQQNNSDRASKLRPYKLSNCLSEKEDFFISGTAKKRSLRLITSLRKNKDNLFYIESNNMPFFIEDFRTFSFYPFLEILLLFLFKLKGYKIGFFYRDLFWRHPDFNSNKMKLILKKGFYYVEWYFLKLLVKAFFLPNKKISELLPRNDKAIFHLYPGLDLLETKPKSDNMPIEFLYVGGALPPFYDLSNLFKLSQMIKNKTFHVCVRKEEWEQIKDMYKPGKNVLIHHIKSAEIHKLYSTSRIILVDPRENEGYVGYSIPFKYFEAIQFGAFITKLSGGVSDELLQNTVFGRSFNNLIEMHNFLKNQTKNTYDEQLKLIIKNRNIHSWESRIEQIRNNLLTC